VALELLLLLLPLLPSLQLVRMLKLLQQQQQQQQLRLCKLLFLLPIFFSSSQFPQLSLSLSLCFLAFASFSLCCLLSHVFCNSTLLSDSVQKPTLLLMEPKSLLSLSLSFHQIFFLSTNPSFH
jgi:hypothetical protein